jgi:hypothetical protein
MVTRKEGPRRAREGVGILWWGRRDHIPSISHGTTPRNPTKIPKKSIKAAKQQQPTSRREVDDTNYNVCIQKPSNLPHAFQHKDPNMATLRANLTSDQHNQSLIKPLSTIRTGWWGV